MTLPRLFFVTLLAALACSGPASAGVELQARDVALPAAANARGASAVRVLPARTAPLRFNLVGLHWQGTGTVSFRTATATGRWSAWHAAAPEEEDGPNAGSAERKRLAAWRLGSPYWTGDGAPDPVPHVRLGDAAARLLPLEPRGRPRRSRARRS